MAPSRPASGGQAGAKPARPSARSGTTIGATGGARAKAQPAPVLVRQVRGEIAESEHRGHVAEAELDGQVSRLAGSADQVVLLRSIAKPFGLAAFVAAGGADEFQLSPAELAVMAGSHSGEDLHVRTLQGVYRRTGAVQNLLACGTEGAPLDKLTAARLARDGEHPGSIRHRCSGQHSAMILHARMMAWPQAEYWQDDHPAQVAYREAIALAFGTSVAKLVIARDDCGLETFAFPLSRVARAAAFLADPESVPADDPRAVLAPALLRIRDAMLAHPECVTATRDRLESSLGKTVPDRLLALPGDEGLRAVAILRGLRTTSGRTAPSGVAIKIADGDPTERALNAATVEALRQCAVLDDAALRHLNRYHRPMGFDVQGRLATETVPDFELAPVGELFG